MRESKELLVVYGTSDMDVYNFRDALVAGGFRCGDVRAWNEITEPQGYFDLVVLFGLADREQDKWRLFASTVREAIGPNTKLLMVSRWSPSIMAPIMKEDYKAEYEFRTGVDEHILTKVKDMLKEKTKTAPCV